MYLTFLLRRRHTTPLSSACFLRDCVTAYGTVGMYHEAVRKEVIMQRREGKVYSKACIASHG